MDEYSIIRYWFVITRTFLDYFLENTFLEKEMNEVFTINNSDKPPSLAGVISSPLNSPFVAIYLSDVKCVCVCIHQREINLSDVARRGN